MTLIVCSETLLKIRGHSHVTLSVHGKTLDEIHVTHWPPFAEASEGILLRATHCPKSCEAREREAG